MCEQPRAIPHDEGGSEAVEEVLVDPLKGIMISFDGSELQRRSGTKVNQQGQP